jgi:hypothetical protein
MERCALNPNPDKRFHKLLRSAALRARRARFRSFISYLLIASVFYSQSAVAAQCSVPEFAAARSFPPGGDSTWAVVSGDFNEDGIADVVVSHLSSNTISVLLGNGDGTFQPAVSYPVGFGPSEIAVADFNGDGHLDLAVASMGCAPCAAGALPGGIYVLLGKGDGTFSAPVNVDPGGSAQTIAAGDLNGDGLADLVVGDSGGIGFFSVILNSGFGVFKAPVEFGTATAGGAAIALADVNRDGKLDVVSCNTGSGNLSIALGNGDGTFKSPMVSGNQDILTGSFLFLAVGDFNGDGFPDVVTLNQSVGATSNYAQVWLGNGNGTFAAPVNYTLGGSPTSAVIGDFNGDGILDIGISNDAVNTSIQVLIGNGDGTFKPAVNYKGAGSPLHWIARADFNNDGILDFAAVSVDVGVPSGLWIVLGNGNGTFQSAVPYPVGAGPQGAVAGDFNGDGVQDIAVASNGSNSVSILIGNGDGTFQPATSFPAGGGASYIAAGDFNGDGRLDLAVGNISGLSVSVLLGNGDGTFQAKVDTPLMFGAGALAVGDFNKDGKLDIVVGSLIGMVVLLGNGDGTFRSPGFFTFYGNSPGLFLGNVVVADFNRDGNLDLAAPDSLAGANVQILLGNGDGTFKANVDFVADTQPTVQTVGVGDFNGDGILDLAVADYDCNNCNQSNVPGNVAILLGNGDGTFRAPAYFPTINLPQSIAVADFNGDGISDVAVTNFLTNTVSVMLGRGDGSLLPPSGFGADNGLNFVTATDFNGDGRPDLAILNLGSNDASILLNTCAAQ